MPTWTPEGFAKEMGRWTKKRRKDAKAVAFEVALRGVMEGAETAERLHIVDRRTYIQRFRAVRTKAGAELQNDAPHAAVIEYGRRPGAAPPPVKAILGWLRRKGIGAKKERRAIAFLVSRAIGRRGLPAHAVFRRYLKPKLQRWFRKGLRRMLRDKP